MTIECDEIWSFVGRRDNKQWVWLAIDVDSREIVGLHVGDRSREGAQALWRSLPAVYRQCAVSYTDFWEAYEPSFQRIDIGPWTRKREKPVALSVLTVRGGNGFRVW